MCTEKLKDLYSWVAELSKRQTRERGLSKKADRQPPIRTPVLEDCKFKGQDTELGTTGISQNSVPIKPLQCLWPLGQESLIKKGTRQLPPSLPFRVRRKCSVSLLDSAFPCVVRFPANLEKASEPLEEARPGRPAVRSGLHPGWVLGHCSSVRTQLLHFISHSRPHRCSWWEPHNRGHCFKHFACLRPCSPLGATGRDGEIRQRATGSEFRGWVQRAAFVAQIFQGHNG